MPRQLSHQSIVFIRRGCAVIALAGFMTVTFVNCSSPTTPAAASGSSKAASTAVLTVAPLSQTVDPSSTLQLMVSGGSAPYSYRILVGGGSVSTDGIFTAPSTNDDTLISVTDASGMVVQSEITTYAQQVSTSPVITIIPLSASAAPISVSPGQAATITASNGTPPYSYTLSAGTTAGTLSGNVFTAGFPTAVINATILVTDSAGATASATVTVNPPPMIWTWQGLVYQTTCNGYGICDGVEHASCSGSSCPAAAIQCYTASPRGQPGHAVGATQTTVPTGYNCYLYN